MIGRKECIAVLAHERDNFPAGPYLLRFLLERWRAEGFEIQVMAGPEGFVPAVDIGINHVDLTVTPDPYVRLMTGPARWLNGRVTDISKRTFSSLLLDRDSDYDGPVIVKTDCNYGGVREYLLGNRAEGKSGRPLAWQTIDRINPSRYPIFSSVRQVPDGVWRNRHLIVEKLLVERDDDLFCLRNWVFLGDREISRYSCSKHPIVKAGSIVDSREIDEVPGELRRIRTELGFDYGKFDYAVTGGRVVLYDINRTPTTSRQMTRERQQEILDRLAPGILSYL